jgi:Fic family protein
VALEGKVGLGEHFDAVPGRFVERPGFILAYRAPEHREIPHLIDQLCGWVAKEFHFNDGKQTFGEAVVQAIVTHVYIEWIHPFSDGNGRTGRLVEFYLLLRAGNPDIASHILSNFYNETRSEYYRQLDRAGKTGDLTAFIEYAVQGLRDGLTQVLTTIQKDHFEITWDRYIYEKFAEIRLKQRKRNVFVRQRRLALDMPDRKVTPREMVTASPKLVQMYAGTSLMTIQRDIAVLERLGLVRREGNAFERNIGILTQPARRRVSRPGEWEPPEARVET